jgi:hypothetical protein
MHVVDMYAYIIPIKIKMTRNFVMSLLSGPKAVVGGGEDALATLAIDSFALPRRSAHDVFCERCCHIVHLYLSLHTRFIFFRRLAMLWR